MGHYKLCAFAHGHDRLGSTVATSDSLGNEIDAYTYAQYGESGPEGDTGFPFRFTGQKLDAVTGLYNYKARWYDPETGRFLQTDPIGYGDGMNLYAYVGNDPMNATDPSGLRRKDFDNSRTQHDGGSRSNRDRRESNRSKNSFSRSGLSGFSVRASTKVICFSRSCGFSSPSSSGGGGEGGSGATLSKIDNSGAIDIKRNLISAGFLNLRGSGGGLGSLGNESMSEKIGNFVPSSFTGDKFIVTVSDGIFYFETREIAEAALINAIVAATRQTGDEYSSILFHNPNQAVSGLYEYSYTPLVRGHPGSVAIGGQIPVGANPLAHYHTHNVPSIPNGGFAGLDENLAYGTIPAYVVGLDGKACRIRSTYSC